MTRRRPLRVWFAGGDGIGWALDRELELTRRSLPQTMATGPIGARVIHTVNWRLVAALPRHLLVGRRVLAHMTHDPDVALAQPEFERAAELVGIWLTRSTRAFDVVKALGLRAALVPYSIDTELFRPLPAASGAIARLRRGLRLPADAYVIGSFQRDSEGDDLSSPKLVKGPDVLLEIARTASARMPLHVVLAGPRRHWIRGQLAARSVPFSYTGVPTGGDDLLTNALSQDAVNALYNVVDTYVVASRLEGGPQQVLEAAAANCKIISTRVGHAADILDPRCLFSSAADGAHLLCADRATDVLGHTLGPNRRAALARSPQMLTGTWHKAYGALLDTPALSLAATQGAPVLRQVAARANWVRRGERLLRRRMVK